MSVELDWEKEIGEQGWPRREEQLPPRPGMPRWLRWLVTVAAAVIVGAGLSFWRMSDAGLRAARADVQEALEFAHWAAQQDDKELFKRHLDPTEPAWQTQVMAGWDQIAATAAGVPAPQVEDLELDGYLAETLLRWHAPRGAAAGGESYLVRRWFQLVDGEWRWTRPRTQHWGSEQSESSPHLALDFYEGDGETAAAPPGVPELDAFVAGLCQEYGVAAEQCYFHVQWLLVGDDGLPLPLRDLPLAPLASATADAMDGPLFFANADDREWHSNAFRQRMGEFHPGRAFVSQSRLEVLRPAGAQTLPAALPGEADRPILLPTPWLTGIDAAGKPHPSWQAHARRVLADAVLRRAEGVVMGSAAYVNAAWALHQAVLAIEEGLPDLDQLAPAAAAAPVPAAPLQIPDLSGLGAALQAAPDELALDQLASLAGFLQAGWSQAELRAIPAALGQEAFTSPLLSKTLGLDEAAFLAGWRDEQRRQADSPLARTIQALVDHMEDEAEAREAGWTARGGLRRLADLYTEDGRTWLLQVASSSLYADAPRFGEKWQVNVRDVGAADDMVWVELVEEDGENRMADLRFYRQDETAGWRRTAPPAAFWGQPDTLETGGQVTWTFGQLDRPVVSAVAAEVDDFLASLRADLNLPGGPVQIDVRPDTVAAWDITAHSLQVASPRRYSLDRSASAEQELLAETRLRLAYQQVNVKASALLDREARQDRDDLWAIVAGAMRGLLELRQIDPGSLFDGLEVPMARAMQAGNPPGIDHLLAVKLAPSNSLEASGQYLLVTYILSEQGWQWLDPLFQQGLAATLMDIRAAQHWEPGQLEADWQRYLAGLFAEAGAAA